MGKPSVCLAFLLLFITIIQLSEAKPYTTYLILKNNSKGSVHTNVRWIDNYDWEGGNRPDYNFHNLDIDPRIQVTKREDINTYASKNPFTIDLTTDDGIITLRIDQKIAKDINKDFGHYEVDDGIRYIKSINANDGWLWAANLDSNPSELYTKDKDKVNVVLNETGKYLASVQMLGNTVIIIVSDK